MGNLVPSAMFILGLVMVGFWLEGIGGKHGFWDHVLTPIPMGLGGIIILPLIERAWS